VTLGDIRLDVMAGHIGPAFDAYSPTVDPELLQIPPVSGARVLRSALTTAFQKCQ
jgi:hypothetical protein